MSRHDDATLIALIEHNAKLLSDMPTIADDIRQAGIRLKELLADTDRYQWLRAEIDKKDGLVDLSLDISDTEYEYWTDKRKWVEVTFNLNDSIDEARSAFERRQPKQAA